MQTTFGMAEQRIVGRRFVHEHIERRARDMAAIEKCAQGLFVDEPAARAIDDSHALLGLGEIFRRQNILRLRRQRRVQGNEIGAAEQRFEIDFLDPKIEGAFRAKERDHRR